MQWNAPEPRGDETLEKQLTQAVRRLPGGVLRWDALSSARYPGWIGVRLAPVAGIGRRWSLDVQPGGAHAPLTIRPPMDIVAVKVWDASRPWVRARLVCGIEEGLEEVEIPAAAWPPSPWQVDVAPGWSTAAITSAATRWIQDRVGRDDLVLCAEDETVPESLAVGDVVRAVESAFDELLAMEPGDAAVLCTVLTAFAEALGRGGR